MGRAARAAPYAPGSLRESVCARVVCSGVPAVPPLYAREKWNISERANSGGTVVQPGGSVPRAPWKTALFFPCALIGEFVPEVRHAVRHVGTEWLARAVQ